MLISSVNPGIFCIWLIKIGKSLHALFLLSEGEQLFEGTSGSEDDFQTKLDPKKSHENSKEIA